MWVGSLVSGGGGWDRTCFFMEDSNMQSKTRVPIEDFKAALPPKPWTGGMVTPRLG